MPSATRELKDSQSAQHLGNPDLKKTITFDLEDEAYHHIESSSHAAGATAKASESRKKPRRKSSKVRNAKNLDHAAEHVVDPFDY